MIIEESFRVDAPREQVATFLLDAEAVSRCVPGVQDVDSVGDGAYEATLHAQLGPVAAAFQGSMRIDDSQAPERLIASGEGRDRRSGSRAKVEFTADLAEEDARTRVQTQADVVIRGRLGQFGTGVIASTAREMVREFADCVNARLDGAGDGTPAPASDPPARRAPASLVRVTLRGVWSWLVGLVRSATSRLRQLFGRGE